MKDSEVFLKLLETSQRRSLCDKDYWVNGFMMQINVGSTSSKIEKSAEFLKFPGKDR